MTCSFPSKKHKKVVALPMGAGQIFNFILKCHCTDDFSRQVARCFPATAKVVGTRQIKNLSCTLPDSYLDAMQRFFYNISTALTPLLFFLI